MDVAAWLRELGFEQYEPAFRENEIDERVLPSLTAEDLKDLGVALVGHRRRLMDAIAALGSPPPAAAEPAVAADAERRQLTVMFCDLVDSTELAVRLDPEDLREIVAAYHRVASDMLARFGGFVAKYMGDGVLAYFGYPQAHEDDAEQSARAGLALVDAVTRLDLGERLRLRIGIATGLVVVGDLLGAGAAQEQGVVGETPNLAARLQALAEPNAIVVDEATRRQIGGLFDVRDLGLRAMKGFAGEQRAWRVAGESGIASRYEALRSGETPLVGREEELDLLLRRWAQAKAGEGRVVLLSAEPGIGKSRLTEALQQRIAVEPQARQRYFCSPHDQDSALFPIIGELERAAGFTREDDAATRRGKLAASIAATGPAPDDLPLLAELLSLPGVQETSLRELSPPQKKIKTFEALLRRLEGLARRQPVLLIFEDLHWLDPTSRELLDRLIARAEHLSVLLIATFRPEFVPPWTGRPHVTTLSLARLGRREGAELVRQLVGDAALPAEIIDEIIERTDGVPLFLEEVTKAVIERAAGSDAATARGAVSAIPSARVAVPATLQASLLARLDRLGPIAREVAQIGAAIGREFSHELVAAAARRNAADLEAGLDRLVAAGLVFRRGTPPEADYQFKHALVQDTAYGTLLRGPRQSLHARIVQALERNAPEVAERQPEILAHHLTEAAEYEKAAAKWLEAGRRAARQSNNVEAIAHLRRGLAVLDQFPEGDERRRRELAFRLDLGPAVMSVRGLHAAEAEEIYSRVRELAEELDDDRARFAGAWVQWLFSDWSGGGGRHLSRHQLAEQLFPLAERLDDSGLRLQAHHSSWATRVWHGDLTDGCDHVRRGLALYDRDAHRGHALLYGGHDPAVCGHGTGAMAEWLLGSPDRAVESARAGIRLAEALSHVPSVGHALWFAGTVHLMRRDVPAVLDHAERSLALGNEHDLALYRAVGGLMRGWALVQLGRTQEGLPELRRWVDIYTQTSRVMRAFFSAVLAEAELRGGNPENAAQALSRAADASEAQGETFWHAQILCLEGDMLLMQSPAASDEAEALYRQAIDAAREQQARSLELRSAATLARLWRRQGRRDRAHALLAPIYGGFTEGFETADLLEAKALLHDLA